MITNAYTILVNDDNTLLASHPVRIMYRSTGVDNIRFLVKPIWNGLDMTKFTVALEYRLPISHTYDVIFLTPSAELYKERLEYVLPVDISLTCEVGDIELALIFAYPEAIENGEIKEYVRKTDSIGVKICDTNRWSDYIADTRLDNIAQMILINKAIANEIKANAELIAYSKADGIAKDETTNEIYLTSNGVEIGNRIKDADSGADGLEVVDINKTISTPNEPEKEDDNTFDVVDF